MTIKDQNYFVVHGWMRSRLGLTGNELLVYAMIYGFSQADSQRFTGSRQYLADFIGAASKRTVDSILQSLQAKGLLHKFETEQRGVKFCEYVAVVPPCNNCTTGAKIAPPPVQNLHHPGAKIAPPPVQNLHPIINIYKECDKEKDKERESTHARAGSDLAASLGDMAEPFRQWLELWKETHGNGREMPWVKQQAQIRALLQMPEDVRREAIEKATWGGWKSIHDIREDMPGGRSTGNRRSEIAERQRWGRGEFDGIDYGSPTTAEDLEGII